jgi:hypothetical protein
MFLFMYLLQQANARDNNVNLTTTHTTTTTSISTTISTPPLVPPAPTTPAPPPPPPPPTPPPPGATPLTTLAEFVRVQYDWSGCNDDALYNCTSVKRTYAQSAYKNAVIAGVKLYKDELYLTVPRWRSGVPATLNRYDRASKLLVPFPSWVRAYIFAAAMYWCQEVAIWESCGSHSAELKEKHQAIQQDNHNESRARDHSLTVTTLTTEGDEQGSVQWQ